MAEIVTIRKTKNLMYVYQIFAPPVVQLSKVTLQYKT